MSSDTRNADTRDLAATGSDSTTPSRQDDRLARKLKALRDYNANLKKILQTTQRTGTTSAGQGGDVSNASIQEDHSTMNAADSSTYSVNQDGESHEAVVRTQSAPAESSSSSAAPGVTTSSSSVPASPAASAHHSTAAGDAANADPHASQQSYASEDSVPDYLTELKTLRSSHSELVAQVSSVRVMERTLDDMRLSNERLEHENTRLRDECNRLEFSHKSMSSKVSALMDEIDSLCSENDALKQHISLLQHPSAGHVDTETSSPVHAAKAAASEDRVWSLEQRLAIVTADLKAAQDQVTSLRHENHSLSSELSLSKGRLSDFAGTEQRLRDRCAQLEQELTNERNLVEDLRVQRQSIIADLDSQIHALQVRYESALSQHRTSETELSKEREEHHAQLQVLRKERDEFRVRCAELEGVVRGRQSTIQALQDRLSSMNDRDSVTTVGDDSSPRLVSSVSSMDTIKMDEELSVLRTEKVRLEAELIHASENAHREKVAHAELMRSLQLRESQSEKQRMSMERELDQLRNENITHVARLDATSRENADLMRIRLTLEAAVAEKNGKIASLEADWSMKVRDLEVLLSTRTHEYETVIRDLRRDVLEKQSEITDYRHRLSDRQQSPSSRRTVISTSPSVSPERTPLPSPAPTASAPPSQQPDLSLALDALRNEKHALEVRLSETEVALVSADGKVRALDDENRSLEQRYAVLRTALEEQASSYSSRLKEANDELAVCKSQLHQSQQAKETLADELRTVTDKYTLAVRMHEDAKKQLESERRDKAGLDSSLQKQFASLEAERDELYNKLQTLQRDKLRQVHDLQTSLDALRQEVADMKLLLAQKDAQNLALRERYDGVQSEKASLISELQQMRAVEEQRAANSIAVEVAERERLQLQLEDESVIDDLRSQLSSSREELRTERALRQSVEHELSVLRNDYTSLSRRFDAFLQDKSAENVGFESFRAESEAARLRLEDNLRKSATDLQAMTMQLERMNAENTRLQEGKVQLERESAQQLMEFEDSHKRFTTMVASLENRIDTLSHERDNLSNELSLSALSHREVVAQLQAEISKVNEERLRLSQDVSAMSASHNSHNSALRAQLTALQTENDRLRSDLDSLSNETDVKVSQLLDEREDLVSRLSDMAAHRESDAKTLSDVRSVCDNQASILLSCQMELREAGLRADRESAAKFEWQRAFAELEATRSKEKEQHATLLDAAQQRITSLSEVVSHLEMRNDELAAECRSHALETQRLQRALDSVSMDQRELSQKFEADLQAVQAVLDRERDSHAAEVTRLQQQHVSHVSERERQAEIEKQRLVDDLSLRHEDARRRIQDDLAAELAAAHAERDVAFGELETRTREFEDERQQLSRAFAVAEEKHSIAVCEMQHEIAELRSRLDERARTLLDVEDASHSLRHDMEHRILDLTDALKDSERKLDVHRQEAQARQASRDAEFARLEAELRSTISQLGLVNESLTAKVHKLEMDMRDQRLRWEDEQAQLRAIHDERLADVENERREALAYAKTLEHDKATLLADHLDATAAWDAEAESLRSSHDNMRRLLLKLRNDLLTSRSVVADVVERKFELLQMHKLRREYETVATTNHNMADELRRIESTFAEQRAAWSEKESLLRDELSRLEVSNSSSHERILVLEGQVSSLENANALLSDRLKGLVHERGAEGRNAGSLQERLSTLEDEVVTLRADKRELVTQVEKLQKQRKDALQHATDIETTTSSRIASLEGELKALRTEHHSLRANFRETSERKEVCERELVRLKDDFAMQSASSSEKTAELLERCTFLQTEADRLQDQLAREKRKREEAERKVHDSLESMSRTRDALRGEWELKATQYRTDLASANRKIEQLTMELEVLKRDYDRVYKSRSVNDKDRERDRIASATQDTSILERIRVLETMISNVSAEKDGLATLLLERDRELASLRASVDVLQVEKKSLQALEKSDRSSSAGHDLTPTERARFQELQAAHSASLSRIDDLTRQLLLRDRDLQEVREQAGQLERESNALRESLSAAASINDERCKRHESEVQNLRNALLRMQAEKDKLIQRLGEVDSKLAASAIEAERLQSELSTLRGQVAAHEREADNFLSTASLLEQDRDRIVKALRELETENAMLRSHERLRLDEQKLQTERSLRRSQSMAPLPASRSASNDVSLLSSSRVASTERQQSSLNDSAERTLQIMVLRDRMRDLSKDGISKEATVIDYFSEQSIEEHDDDGEFV